jgi:hypothetical protein
VPRSVLGGIGYVQPSDMLNIVGVGVGGRGASDIHGPSRIQDSSSLYSADYLPAAEWVIYEFPARGNMPPVSLTWVDGGLRPPLPDRLEAGRKLATNKEWEEVSRGGIRPATWVIKDGAMVSVQGSGSLKTM